MSRTYNLETKRSNASATRAQQKHMAEWGQGGMGGGGGAASLDFEKGLLFATELQDLANILDSRH